MIMFVVDGQEMGEVISTVDDWAGRMGAGDTN